MKLSIAVALIIVASAFHAYAAGTDLEQFQKVVAKAAPFDTGKSKTACLCFDPSYVKRARRMKQYLSAGNVYLNCEVPVFGSGGVSVGSHTCSDFLVVR